MRNARAALWLLWACATYAQTRVVALPGDSPLVTFRIVFLTGAASDPTAQPGLANLTAAMLAGGGTRYMTYKQIVNAMFPMAGSVSAQVDKEMTTFMATTHVDNLDAFYKLFRAMLLEPGWREEDFKRVKDDTLNYLRVGLRGNNDEELGKEVLYNALYEGTPYGHQNAGTIPALEAIALEDVRKFYQDHYTQQNIIIGIAGGYPKEFLTRLEKDMRILPEQSPPPAALPAPPVIERNRALVIEKDTRSVAYSVGYPIEVRRGDPDFPALLLAQTYLGCHRSRVGRLYHRMRELRGLNYGDYAYIEYFPRGMFLFEPSPNLARHRQIFQIWIRPVEPATASFALRLAMFELHKLVTEGLSEEAFERTRTFLLKYVNLLTKTKSGELGYAIDSLFYGIPEYKIYISDSLAKLTTQQVNDVIRRRLRGERVQIVAVARNAEDLKKQLTAESTTSMVYNSPKPAAIIEEDKVVEKWNLNLRPEDVNIIPVAHIFEDAAPAPGKEGMTFEAAQGLGPPSPADLKAILRPGSVGLIWNPVPVSSVREYRVYRFTGDDPATVKLIGRSAVGSSRPTEFEDTAISRGAHYGYFVTAADESGKQSDYSNVVTVSIP